MRASIAQRWVIVSSQPRRFRAERSEGEAASACVHALLGHVITVHRTRQRVREAGDVAPVGIDEVWKAGSVTAI